MDPKSIGHAADAIAVHRTDIRERITEIKTPTLVVVGAEDTAVSPENSDEIAHLIPDAQLQVLPAAGHLLTLDQPAQATDVLLGFLNTFETPHHSN
jgi:pimeloyl-ACP methyl ester carboxylesterase